MERKLKPIDVLWTMQSAANALCTGEHVTLAAHVNWAKSAVAELIEAAESLVRWYETGFAHAGERTLTEIVPQIRTALAAVTAHPNDAEGRT